MKLSDKIICIPPYISTSWKNVHSLSTEIRDQKILLQILLNTGEKIAIPNLEKQVIALIFEMHSRHVEQEGEGKKKGAADPFLGLPLPLRFHNGALEAFGSILQHNPDQKNAPTLPPDVLQKIASVTKSLGVEDPNLLPKAEPNCNCLHCQIANAMQQIEEIVKDEELKFKNWEITQINTKLYTVCNPLDKKEQYNVFLGTPVGCTCGQRNCEHIRAVLES